MNIFLFVLILSFLTYASATVELECKNPFNRDDYCKVSGATGNFQEQPVEIISTGEVDNLQTMEIINVHFGQLPIATIMNYPNLLDFKCTNCHLTTLEGIYEFRNLESLTLSGNLINEIRAQQLENINLTNVALTKNHIKSVDERAFRHIYRLRFLDLSENEIVYLPKRLFRMNLEYLESIKLSMNSIRSIKGVFDGLVALRELDLSSNRISDISDEIFEDSLALKAISLAFNEIDFIHPNAFQSQINLCRLNLNGNRLGAFSLDITKPCPVAFTLDISRNYLRQLSITVEDDHPYLMGLVIDASFNRLQEFSTQNMIALKSVNLQHNEIRKLTGNFAQMYDFDFNNNKMSREIFNIIMSSRNLKRISVNDSGIDERHFMLMLHLPKLEVFDVSYNTQLHNVDFAQIYPPIANLWQLKMKFCGIEKINVDLLQEKFTALEVLALSGNKLKKSEINEYNEVLKRYKSKPILLDVDLF